MVSEKENFYKWSFFRFLIFYIWKRKKKTYEYFVQQFFIHLTRLSPALIQTKIFLTQFFLTASTIHVGAL